MYTSRHPCCLHPSTHPEADSDEGQDTAPRSEEERSGVPDSPWQLLSGVHRGIKKNTESVHD